MFHPSPLALKFAGVGGLQDCPRVNASPSGGRLLQTSSKAVRNDLRAGGEFLLISVQVF